MVVAAVVAASVLVFNVTAAAAGVFPWFGVAVLAVLEPAVIALGARAFG